MTSLESLISNLAADDLSIRLYAILTLHEQKSDAATKAQLVAAAARETDPSLRLYLTWLASPEQKQSVRPAEAIICQLNSVKIDWVSLFYSMHLLDRKAAAEVLPAIRRLDTAQMPIELLPMLVRFYQRFGTIEDNETIAGWCTNPNPVVMSLAIEALSRIQPERLKNLLLPLLSNQSPGIRSRAIRLLHRWYPEEAPRHLAGMLNSEIIDDRRAALANAYFLPFDEIKLELLRFLIKEESPVLLQQAGNILTVNPDLPAAEATASIAVNSPSEKAPIIKQILCRMLEFHVKAGMTSENPEENAAKLINQARQNRQNRLSQTVNPDKQAQLVSRKISENLEQAASWLKKEFSISLPAPVLLVMVENLAGLDPEFLRPYLPELLRSSSLPIQVAALTALARVSPGQAEKLLEQYIFSSAAQRRKTGFHVLSLMEKAFAIPLMIRAFAREQDPGLLDFYGEKFPDPPDPAFLSSLFRESCLAGDTHACRTGHLKKLCLRWGADYEQLARLGSQTNDFALETVMVNRAEVEAIADAAAEKKQSSDPGRTGEVSETASPADDYLQKNEITRFFAIQGILQSTRTNEDELKPLIAAETEPFLRFQLETALKKIELHQNSQFSPVAHLQKNLARPVPLWSEVAAGLASIQQRSARLAAPLLQSRKWQSWPEEIIPAVLMFIARSGQPLFSAQAGRFLQHSRPAVRFCAVQCLEMINPEELLQAIDSLQTDNSPEVAAYASEAAKRLASAQNSMFIRQRRQIPARAGLDRLLKFFPASSWLRPVSAGLVLLLFYMMFIRITPLPVQFQDQTVVRGQPAQEIARFASWRQKPENGQERVVFGRVEKVLADSIIIVSPALQRQVLIRGSSGSFACLENDHFSARVKITAADQNRIEAVLLDGTK